MRHIAGRNLPTRPGRWPEKAANGGQGRQATSGWGKGLTADVVSHVVAMLARRCGGTPVSGRSYRSRPKGIACCCWSCCGGCCCCGGRSRNLRSHLEELLCEVGEVGSRQRTSCNGGKATIKLRRRRVGEECSALHVKTGSTWKGKWPQTQVKSYTGTMAKPRRV